MVETGSTWGLIDGHKHDFGYWGGKEGARKCAVCSESELRQRSQNESLAPSRGSSENFLRAPPLFYKVVFPSPLGEGVSGAWHAFLEI